MNHRWTDLAAFVAVADHLSFQRAAAERGVTRSALSHAVKGLEQDLGVRLLNRNTRSVSLTEAGRLLHARLKPAFGDVAQAIDEVSRWRDTPAGTIRITVPRPVGLMMMGAVIARLVRDCPGLAVEVSSDDALIDIVAADFDAGIRFGERLQQGMIATRIALPMRFAVVGAPAYFDDHPRPERPADLHAHRCIRYRFPSGAMFQWEFEKDGEPLTVAVDGPVVSNDQELIAEAALAGAGLAFVFEDRVSRHLASGALVRCLEDWTPHFDDVFLYYPHRAYMPAGLRALIDILKDPRRRDPQRQDPRHP
ncbi:LysR family transcriptional regulator [Rhodoplanes azumiensis]|uniref:LysR family transcriptional regulator n=1 Tax=Rhodoplanes azumiensis TaxID=1897628 RepID=A0ABW5AGQ2_9BRAD